MILVQEKLVSDEVVQAHFICNLEACKGACCWEGDSGAPLETSEVPTLRRIYEQVKPFLSPAGIFEIERQGHAVWSEGEREWATPLIDNGPCAYMVLDGTGTAKCGIEQAWLAGKVDFKKPISCHLYPIRVAKNEETGFEALNYDRWHICNPACALGQSEQMPLYQFVREAIVRAYGEDFYEELDAAAQFVRGETA